MPININRMIFLRTAWMEFYQGQDNDTQYGEYDYIIDNPNGGHEKFNFLPFGNTVYGYAPVNNDSINISHIDSSIEKTCDEIDGVTVIFFSHHPDPKKKAYIVGWYENATVFRNHKEHIVNGRNYCYNCITNKSNAFLIPLENRNKVIPLAKENGFGYGMSAAFFADKDDGQLRRDVIEYIQRVKNSIDINPISVRYTHDIEIKRQVETRAIEKVMEYYENEGYEVKSVESENKGWDLEAKKKDEFLKIEVKGKRGDTITVRLSSNEYDKLHEYYDSYKLCIVTNTLQEDSILTIFDIEKRGDIFYGVDVNNRKNILEFEEKVSAICKLK